MKQVKKATPVKKISKMKTGGTSKSGLCPDGYYWSVQGCQEKTPGYKGPLSSRGSKIGVGAFMGSLLTEAGIKLGQKINQKQKTKKEAEETINTIKKANLQKKGGSVKSKKRK